MPGSPRRGGRAWLWQRVRSDCCAGWPCAWAEAQSARATEAACGSWPYQDGKHLAASRQPIGAAETQAAASAASCSSGCAAVAGAGVGRAVSTSLAGSNLLRPVAAARQNARSSRTTVLRCRGCPSPVPLRSCAAEPEGAGQGQSSARCVGCSVYEQQDPHRKALCKPLRRPGAEKRRRSWHNRGSTDPPRFAAALAVAALQAKSRGADWVVLDSPRVVCHRVGSRVGSPGGFPERQGFRLCLRLVVVHNGLATLPRQARPNARRESEGVGHQQRHGEPQGRQLGQRRSGSRSSGWGLPASCSCIAAR